AHLSRLRLPTRRRAEVLPGVRREDATALTVLCPVPVASRLLAFTALVTIKIERLTTDKDK
ncbi:MAG TPA: hypothetical protein VF747_04825, partial [Blastocatellia bacterium]